MKKIAIAMMLVAGLAGILATYGQTRSPKAEISRNLDIFTSVYKTLQTLYVDTIDAEKSISTAINAMLDEIDPYTEYIPEKEQSDFMAMTTGEYGGIGSYIQERKGGVIISEPREGTPAAEAGLRAGDRFVMIDGDSVATLPSAEISKRLKGQPGTNVSVTVVRPYAEDSVLTFDLTRRKIDMGAVPYYGIAADGAGYIQVTSFSEKTYDEVRHALLELKKDPRLRSIVLDLRGNGGGLLESAVKMVGLFVPKGTEVIRQRGRGMMNEKIYKTTSKPVDTEIPLAVLINGGTASSAEIVSGSLQDLDRAIIVGERSFGKGLVQTTREVPYNGMVKVTIAKYYLPSGRLIQAIDYSHRNPDGSVARIPDSLTTVFHTMAGREVRDGGGITPDVKTTYPEPTRLVYNLVRDNWIFDFATKYVATHDTIAPPETFEVDDSLFAQLKAFVDPERFKYDRACELVMEQLEKAVVNEGYMNSQVQAQLDTLKTMLRHDLYHDLDLHRKQISEYLATELLTRYYYSRGATIEALRHDIDLDAATAVLNDPEQLRRMLSAPKE